MGYINDIIARLWEVGQPVHISCAMTLEHIANDFLPNTAERVSKLNAKQYSSSVSVSDLQVVTRLLEGLINKLPQGSVWLGLSKLQKPEAWGKDLGGWNEKLLERSENGDIHICRIWALDTDKQLKLRTGIGEQSKSIKEVMEDQQKRRVFVRYVVKPYPDDFLLIWVPQADGTRLNLELLASLPNDPISVLKRAGYKRLHGLRFDISSSLVLATVNILSFDETERGEEAIFTAAWSSSLEI